MARNRFIFSTQPQRTPWKIAVVVCLVLIAAGGVGWFFFVREQDTNESNRSETKKKEEAESTSPTIPEVTDEKILCDREGGRFLQIPEGIPTCAPRTQDAGKICRSKSDCESNCLATSTTEKTGTGVCDDFIQPAGTRALVSEGKTIKTVVE